VGLRGGAATPAVPIAKGQLKRLKLRDFQAGSDFPLSIKRATICTVPKGAIGRARFRAYIAYDPKRT
jgi:hypothetical protein